MGDDDAEARGDAVAEAWGEGRADMTTGGGGDGNGPETTVRELDATRLLDAETKDGLYAIRDGREH